MNHTEIFIGIQSRLDSERFPNKALTEILNKKLIIHVIERIQKIQYPHRIALLTPKKDSAKFINILKQNNITIPVFGGSNEDVLARYYEAAEFFNAKNTIMRVTGDNPLVSITLAEQLISLHNESNCNLSHFIENPHGSGVELIEYSALKRSFREAKDPFEREHVTQYIYRNPELFKILEPVSPYKNAQYPNLSIDYPDDKKIVENILKNNPDWDLDLF